MQTRQQPPSSTATLANRRLARRLRYSQGARCIWVARTAIALLRYQRQPNLTQPALAWRALLHILHEVDPG
ncbi:MAG TPA: hypothetical protein PK159_17075, partial [Steroidobacteraceae bacterium]|nr:hypothetical protein [Steroidobacteraceae bacterium]